MASPIIINAKAALNRPISELIVRPLEVTHPEVTLLLAQLLFSPLEN